MTTTREAFIVAAGPLFAVQGIDGPSMRELTRAAGQRNTSALQYHFGDRDGLLRALLDRHGAVVDARRGGLLDHAELRGGAGLSELAATLVLPLASRLDDPDGGPEYLQVVGEVMARPARFADLLRSALTGANLDRWARAVQPLLPPAAVGPPLHRRFAAIRFAHGELAGRARERRRRDHRLFTNQLVDLVTGLLAAPVSSATERLIRPTGGRTTTGRAGAARE